PNLYEVLGKEEITLAEFKEHPAFNSWLKKAVHSLNFQEFTHVQQKTILPFLQEEGLVCRAKTGTGKTYSFVIPLMQHVMDIFETNKMRRRNVSCLVIAPTRDLAQQIHADFRSLNMNNPHLRHKCDVRLWTGGLPPGKRPWGSDVPQIIVGTPGRILANLEDRRWAQHFNELEFRVYDEADRLLDQGFEDQLNAIDAKIKSLRSEKFEPPLRTLLFSATTNDRVTRFAEAQMGKDYKYINCVDDSEAESHAHIEQRLIKTPGIYESHVAAVDEILSNIESKDYKAIFFLPTVVGADFMFRLLNKALPDRFPFTWMLHGKMTQGARRYTTEQFKRTKRGVLICTDVAARGLDFKGVSDVIQMATTQNIEDYIHKIGRTGRAGQPGRATLFLSENELNFTKDLYTQKHIEFTSEVEYEMTAEAEEKLRGKLPEEDVREYVTSLMGFQSSVCDTYRMKKFDVIRSIVLLYRGFIEKEDATIYLSTRMFNNMALPGQLVPDYIEVD
ncbi:DEAD-domain-containing protein, partial [Metschnikowia bicuspidata var. bicuspidata NRRL YB-4993]